MRHERMNISFLVVLVGATYVSSAYASFINHRQISRPAIAQLYSVSDKAQKEEVERKIQIDQNQRSLLETRLQIDIAEKNQKSQIENEQKQRSLLETRFELEGAEWTKEEAQKEEVERKIQIDQNQRSLLETRLQIDIAEKNRKFQIENEQKQRSLLETRFELEGAEWTKEKAQKEEVERKIQIDQNQRSLLETRLQIDIAEKSRTTQIENEQKQRSLLETRFELEAVDEREEVESFEDSEYISLEDDDSRHQIATKLNQDQDKKASFARLAVANSPPGHKLSLKDIENVDIIAVDEHRLEMSAVVCEEEGCVAIYVPVEFPIDCGSYDLEQCVLANIFELDIQAQNKIRKIEEEIATEVKDEEIFFDSERDALHSDSNLNFPPWWVLSNIDTQMKEECDTLKNLLNNDMYQNEVNALARTGLRVTEYGDTLEVIQTALLAAGPCGLYLRAKTTKKDTILEEPIMVEIPLSLGRAAENPSDLRSMVLNAISYVMNGTS